MINPETSLTLALAYAIHFVIVCPQPLILAQFRCLRSFLCANFLLMVLQRLYVVYKKDFFGLVCPTFLFDPKSHFLCSSHIWVRAYPLTGTVMSFPSPAMPSHIRTYPPHPVVPSYATKPYKLFFNQLDGNKILSDIWILPSMCISSFHCWGYCPTDAPNNHYDTLGGNAA